MTDSPTGTDTVLVTGATGFIAQHCMLQLLEAGYRVRGTARAAGRTADVADVLRPTSPPTPGGTTPSPAAATCSMWPAPSRARRRRTPRS
jgi:nucleoside-diphosphate-sugar epimerase